MMSIFLLVRSTPGALQTQVALGRAFEDLKLPFVSLLLESRCAQLLCMLNRVICQTTCLKATFPMMLPIKTLRKRLIR